MIINILNSPAFLAAPSGEMRKRSVSPLEENYKNGVSPLGGSYKRGVSPLGEKRKRSISPLEDKYKEPDHKKQKVGRSLLEKINEAKKDVFLSMRDVRYPDGSFYEGEWKNGAPNGKGKRTYHNGSSYEGEWVNGVKQGKGKYIYPNGTSYEGEWKHGAPNGKGKCCYHNGIFYEGECVNGAKHGQGKHTYLNGSSYEGEWKSNVFHGKGRYTYPDGSFHDGEWINGEPRGKGKRTYHDGSSYEGEWLNGTKHGKGKYTYPDGSFHEGQWANNVRHGLGKHTDSDGSFYEAKWENNKIITSIKNLSDDLFFDLLCGSHQKSPPNGYCLGIVQDYLEKEGHIELAASLKEAHRCSLLSEAEAEKESRAIYDELNSGNKSRLISYGYALHEMGLELASGVYPGFILCTIFNTGKGLNKYHKRHSSDPRKYKLQLQVKIPAEVLTPEIIKTLIQSPKKSQNIDQAYNYILNSSGAEILSSDAFPWKTRQKGNDCSLQCYIKAYWDYKTPDGKGQQIRRQMKQDCREAKIAKEKNS